MEKAKDRENNKNRWENSCREREGGQKEAGRRWRRVTGNTYLTLLLLRIFYILDICFGFKGFDLVPSVELTLIQQPAYVS